MGQIKTRPTLKGYFETGNIPSQAQYGDLIDSNLNLADTGVQIVPGTLSSSIFISNEISSSGDIIAVGTIKGATSTFDTVDTGQGANELYAMNQEVTTTSNVLFNNITKGVYNIMEGYDTDKLSAPFSHIVPSSSKIPSSTNFASSPTNLSLAFINSGD